MSYKELNKELVEQVQSMKLLLKDYQTEIINLKAQMSKQHEDNLLLKKKCFYRAIQNCKELVEILEPESLLLNNLQQYEEIRQDEQQPTYVTKRGTDRRFTEISEEIRRSNNLIHSRNSLNSLSPLRESDNVMEVRNTSSETSKANTNIIYEEDEDEYDTATVYELNTITTITDDEGEPEEEIVTQKENSKIPTQACPQVTTNDEDESEEEEMVAQNINRLKSISLNENSNSPIQVRELQDNRCYLTNRSIIMHSINTNDEDSVHFSKAVASSTPNSKHNSYQELVLRENIATSPAQSKTLPSTSKRPSRSCKPKNLKEPKLNSKLRNDSSEKSLRETKKK